MEHLHNFTSENICLWIGS